MRTTVLLLLLLSLGTLTWAEENDRPDQPGWTPVIAECPSSVSVRYHDSVSFIFQAINPRSGKPAHPVKYTLTAGPGAIDPLTGVWSYVPGEDPYWKDQATTEIKAVFGNPNLGREATCRFLVRVQTPPSVPFIVNTGAGCGDSIVPYRLIQIRRNYCDAVWYDFDACNPNGDPIIFELVSGPGTINSLTGIWSLPGTLTYGPPNVERIWVRARGQQVGDSVPLVLETVHEQVSIEGCPSDTITLVRGQAGLSKLSTDSYCGHISWSAVDDGDSTTTVSVVDGLLSFRSTTPGVFTVLVIASDGYYADTCTATYSVSAASGFAFTIEKTHMTLQGQYEHIDVGMTQADANYDIGGFNLLIAYDASALSLSEVTKGTLFTQCGWEYFTYRFGADGNCTGGCPSGLVRVVGIAETNNGDHHPICYMPQTLPMTFFTLTFLVSNDRTLECQFVPIRFFWTDCGDNIMASRAGTELLLVNRVFDFYVMDSMPVPPPEEFPSYAGVPVAVCDQSSPYKPTALPIIDFYDGGVDIVCVDNPDISGDLNLNGLQYEIADLDLYSSYFLDGLPVFTINPAGQVATSDINHDGETLTVEDYALMFDVVYGISSNNYVPPSPNQASFIYLPEQKTWSVVTPDTLGAVWLIFDGQVIPTALQAIGPGYTYRDGKTYVFMSMEAAVNGGGIDSVVAIHAGPLFSVDSQATLLEHYAATIHGAKVNTKIGLAAGENDGTTGPQPDKFALHQNFPNPFNPTTAISFDLPKATEVTLEVFNLLGQMVYSQSAYYPAGTHSITWDSKDSHGAAVASGMYYYRLKAGEFSTTRKMLLLK